jgi:magnesium-transporting ATPase (P-type)
MKGADSILMPRMNIDKPLYKALEKDLRAFACKGLRTLIIGNKPMKEDTYDEWMQKFEKVNTFDDPDKESKLGLLYNELEFGFDYIGSSAIEDLL